ncbi:MepB family protein [Flavobacterium sp. F372]|uniref:MepB family protein n=1 Tax=Flavobacterium bernardetii TaxID=2813823 RepID=A0ABR7J2B3_9FLAO|nr:MepB family protein [Flavobacterium bernardetii]MBC5836078.1 MepB family protein [Flavobacterium bernardetii]NHF71182.1 MepB family protein [Flavobacterium bernardetii]
MKENPLTSELLQVKELVYDNCNFEFSNLVIDSESAEYQACSFQLNSIEIIHRFSKITPTKIGQFVTIWKRNNKGITAPFDVSDNFDFIVITSKSEKNLGQFVFPKAVLLEKGIISNNNISGKRGIRVYPPWDIPTSTQAEKTQLWQTKYFYSINKDAFDIELVKKLFTKTNL